MKLQLIHSYMDESWQVSQLRINLDASDYSTYEPGEMVKWLDGQLHERLLSFQNERMQFTFAKTKNSPQPANQATDATELVLEFQSDVLHDTFLEKQRNINVLGDLLVKKLQTFLTLFKKPLQFKLTITADKQISAVEYRKGDDGNWQNALRSTEFDFTYKVYSNRIALNLEDGKLQPSTQHQEGTPLLNKMQRQVPVGRAQYSGVFHTPPKNPQPIKHDSTIPTQFEEASESSCTCSIL